MKENRFIGNNGDSNSEKRTCNLCTKMYEIPDIDTVDVDSKFDYGISIIKTVGENTRVHYSICPVCDASIKNFIESNLRK